MDAWLGKLWCEWIRIFYCICCHLDACLTMYICYFGIGSWNCDLLVFCAGLICVVGKNCAGTKRNTCRWHFRLQPEYTVVVGVVASKSPGQKENSDRRSCGFCMMLKLEILHVVLSSAETVLSFFGSLLIQLGRLYFVTVSHPLCNLFLINSHSAHWLSVSLCNHNQCLPKAHYKSCDISAWFSWNHPAKNICLMFHTKVVRLWQLAFWCRKWSMRTWRSFLNKGWQWEWERNLAAAQLS